jgi:hypothetical protein
VTTTQHQQEDLSRAYVQAVAAMCGLTYSTDNHDYGIDLTLKSIIRKGNVFVPTGLGLDIQAKAATLAEVGTGQVKYVPDARGYNILCDSSARTARILVLLVLPEDPSQWVTVTEVGLVIRRCAYWLSLKGRPPTQNKKSITVTLPRKNLFSVDGLHTIMNRLHNGVEL